MKKILILFLMFLVCIQVVAASNDLRIQDIRFNEFVDAKTSVDFKIYIKNIGSETLKTGLPVQEYINKEENIGFYPYAALLVNTRNPSIAANSMQIIDENGIGTTVFPSYGEIKYIEQNPNPNRDGDIPQPYEVIIEGFYVELNPGDTAVIDTRDAYLDYSLYVPVTKLSLEPYIQEINFIAKQEGSEETRVYPAEIMINPTVKQLDNNTFFAIDGGCINLNEKEICALAQNDVITFSVNDQVQKYDMYGFFWAWLNQVFSDGKLSDPIVIDNVELTVYKEGLKIFFKQ